jgi:GNAT superfamily N-acetyltransferase
MELETIERFYRALNHPRVDIELCPFVGTELAVFLGRRGYRVTEVNNVSVLDLSDFQGINNPGDRFLIREVQENEIEQWSERAAAGFGFFELQEQFSHYAKAKGAVAFAAFSGRQWVAGATVAIHGDVCDLGVTSTIPAYRGRGLQKFLLYARLNYAKRHGLALATVTTEPGTISDLNVQKVGFRCAYTRIKMTLGIEY